MHQRRARPLELSESRGRKRRTCVWECCLRAGRHCVLPLQTQPAPPTSRASPWETHSWLRPHLLNSPQNSACQQRYNKSHHHQAPMLEHTSSKVLSPHYLLLPSPRPHEITRQTLPWFSRHRSRGAAVLQLVWGTAKFRGLTSLGFSHWNILCCNGYLNFQQ